MAQQLTPEQQKQIQERLKNMSPEELQKLVKEQCIFCKIASGQVKSNVVYEDENVMAVLDVQPANPGHVVIFPKEHYSIIPQIPDADVARLFTLAKYLSVATFEATGAQGTNMIVSTGAIAGQGAPHAMIHVIPRFEKDGMPQQFWQAKELQPEQMTEIAKRIKEKLGNVKTTSVAPARPVAKRVTKKSKADEELEKFAGTSKKKLPRAAPRSA